MKFSNLLAATGLIAAGLIGIVAPASAQSELKTIEPGTLTVAIPDFPYPGFIEGPTPARRPADIMSTWPTISASASASRSSGSRPTSPR